MLDSARFALPRLTDRVFRDLAVYMIGAGLVTGVALPFALALGFPLRQVLTPWCFAASTGAGLVVGVLNYRLAHRVLGRRVRALAVRMTALGDRLLDSADRGSRAGQAPQALPLPVDSADELGAAAAAFNGLLGALSRAESVARAVRDFSTAFVRRLEPATLAAVALEQVLGHTGSTAGSVSVRQDGQLVTLATIGGMTEAAAGAHGADGLVVLPIRLDGTAIGVMTVLSNEAMSPEMERLLALLCDSLAVALDNALLHERLTLLASVDDLTGLPTRREGLRFLERAQPNTTGRPVGVLLVDVDHFKRVNDAYGHPFGDVVLAEVSQALQGCLRPADTVARYAGEEFMVVLPDADSEAVVAVGERLRAAVRALRLRSPGGTELAMRVSIGAVSATGPHGLDKLLRLAAGALSESKRAGRDRLTLAFAG